MEIDRFVHTLTFYTVAARANVAAAAVTTIIATATTLDRSATARPHWR